MPERQEKRRTQVQRRAESRDKLLRAAAELIAEAGLAGVTLAEVGERAGYSRGIANHHFGTKAALIAELIDQVEREFLEVTAPAVNLDTSIDELVERASIFLGLLADLPAIHRAFLVLWAAAVADAGLRQRMAALDEDFRRAVSKTVERGQACEEIDAAVDAFGFAIAFLGQLRGIALQHLLSPESVDLDATRHSVEQSLRTSLRPAVEGAG